MKQVNFNLKVANTQLVGRVIAEIINRLIGNKQLKKSGLHMIGHSLGAHVAGYTASNYYNGINGIDRITGMGRIYNKV